MPPSSNQATVSLALAAVMVAAVGALAYPLFAEDDVPAASPAVALVAPANPDKEAGPSESVSKFLAEHAPVVEPKAEEPVAPAVAAPAQPAPADTPAAAPVALAIPTPQEKAEPVIEPPSVPQESAQQKRQREQHEALVARQAARAAAHEKAAAEKAARVAAQKAAAEKAAEERAVRAAADKLAAEKAAAEKAARLAAEKAASERASADKLARAHAEPAAAAAPVAPVAKKVVAPSAGWEEVSTEKPAVSKRDMTVVVSGDRAWVQVDPKRTITVKAGDVLPGMGRVLEVRDNKVVTEKGTLTNN